MSNGGTHLDHIRWRRLTITAHRRTRQNPAAGNIPYRPNQPTHGTSIQTQATSAIEAVNQARTAARLDPSRLAVLELKFLGDAQRDHLEKLNVQILEETERKVPLAAPYYSVNVTFEDGASRDAAQSGTIQPPTGLQGFEIKRGSLGAPHEKKLEFKFPDLQSAQAFQRDDAQKQALGITKAQQPVRVSTQSQTRVIVQFPDQRDLTRFQSEARLYQTQSTQRSQITDSQRRELFDSMNEIRNLGPAEKTGPRLTNSLEQIDPAQAQYIDVDLWHPGPAGIAQVIADFSAFMGSLGGTITDHPTPVGDSLLLSRVRTNRAGIEALQRFDRVAFVELPTQIPPLQFSALEGATIPHEISRVGEDASLVCLVDSGVVAGHPLLTNTVVEERDFDSGEGTPSDTVGHGTHLAGVIVYGDTVQAALNGTWEPKVRLLSAKVLRRGPNGEPVFSDELRAESQIRSAIRYYHSEHSCRIFNLSIGHLERPYLDGRQHPWALMLDELSRELDIVCIISAGNVSNPNVPQLVDTNQFQRSVLGQILSPDHALIDPATSMLSLTVGAISHSDVAFPVGGQEGARPPITGAPQFCPSPFTRTGVIATDGPAPKRAIKPELAAFGGNYALAIGNRNWNQRDFRLGVPSLNAGFRSGRPLATQSGTSVAAAYVSHCAALVEERLRVSLNPTGANSSNLIRALTVHSARVPTECEGWLESESTEGELKTLRTVGYGKPIPEAAMFSSENRVTLFSEDDILDNYFHLYELDVPEEFVQTSGRRGLRVTLAYDPPVRGSRREYLSRNLWFKVYRGVSTDLITAAMGRTQGSGNPPQIPSKFEVEARPTNLLRQWSTVQSGYFFGSTVPAFGNYRPAEGAQPVIHILVGSTVRFTPEDLSETQRYALVASIEHSNASVRLHQVVRESVRIRQRPRG